MADNNTLPNAPIRIFSTNAQSLRNKITELEIEIQDIEIACITETWLGPTVNHDDLQISNFNGPLRRDRLDQEYGGVAVYSRKGLPVKRRKDLEPDNIELMWVEITSTTGTFLLGTIYRPPNSSADLWLSIEAAIERACDTTLHVILLGDINQDMMCTPNKFTQVYPTTACTWLIVKLLTDYLTLLLCSILWLQTNQVN